MQLRKTIPANSLENNSMLQEYSKIPILEYTISANFLDFQKSLIWRQGKEACLS